ncbi:MAG: sulfite exporter TauE/SafE family protein [Herpetosiphon sp.]
MSQQGQVLLAPVLGLVIGLALGMLGGGGSILTVPILVYILRQDPHIAVATSLVIVGLNSLIGAGFHWRDGHVKLKQALIFSAYGIPAAYLGARLSKLLSGPLLLVLFALLMLVIAGLMVFSGRRPAIAATAKTSAVWWRVLLGGVGVGFLTGFLGVGGGFLIVPALVLLVGMTMVDAVGSSLLVIALNSAAGFAGHLNDGALPWLLIAVFLTAGLIGLWLGSLLTRKLSADRLRQSFAVFVVALAIVLLGINVPAVVHARPNRAAIIHTTITDQPWHAGAAMDAIVARSSAVDLQPSAMNAGQAT